MPSPATSAACFRVKATSADPAAHFILPGAISKEPLGPVSPQSDAQFADIIRWTVWGLLSAEEFGITSENIGDFMDSEEAGVGRLLGLGDNVAGEYLGINDEFMVDVITQLGNYGEIFDRNLGPDTIFGLERGFNALWTDGGLALRGTLPLNRALVFTSTNTKGCAADVVAHLFLYLPQYGKNALRS